MRWQVWRQRTENLSLFLGLDGQNTYSDAFGVELTRDKIRSLRLRANYDVQDRWSGFNLLNATLSRGLGVMSASDAGDANLSRVQAQPDYTTLSVSAARLQPLPAQLTLVAQLAGQWASDPLFSAEEFGFGGQQFGRAYDPSELTGDHGLAGLLELRYEGLDEWRDFALTPFGYYDIGRTWDEDSDGQTRSAASAGFGLRYRHALGLKGMLGLAFPLTKPIDNPIYGNAKQPRVMFQLGLDV
jgi:Hemolysin activation/secretion protein